MSFRGLLDKTVWIQKNTTTIGADGTASSSWAQEASSVKCAIQPINGASSQDAIGVTLGAQFKAYFEYSVDLQPTAIGGVQDRIVDTLSFATPVFYNVLYVEDMAGRGRFKKAYLKLAE